jgi:GNAT superfamily N-acetyltransferase
MQIRKASKEELDTIIDMGKAMQDESMEYEPRLIFNQKESYNHYLNELSNPRALIIVAVDQNNDIAGYQYSFMSKLDYLSSSNNECTMEALYVLPKFRRQGIGKLLTRFAEDWAVNEQQADRIRANIYSGNRASEVVHESAGFVPYNIEYIKYIQ